MEMENKVDKVVVKDIFDISVQTAEVQDVKFFYYRKAGGKLVRDIVIKINNTDYHFYGKMAQRIFRYLNEMSLPMILRYRDLKDLTYEERNKILLNALKDADRELMLSVKRSLKGDSYYVLRISSTEYIPIPHSVVISAIEEALGNAKICFTKTIQKERGMFITYDTELAGKEYKYRIWAYNYNDGSHGLRLGTGAFILVCSNGLIRYVGDERMRIIHKTEIEQVKAKIVDFIDTALHKHLDLDSMIEKAKQMRINRDRVVELIEKQRFNQTITQYLKDQISKAENLWDISQAFTFVGTHASDISLKQRFELQRLGGRILEDSNLYQQIVATSVTI